MRQARALFWKLRSAKREAEFVVRQAVGLKQSQTKLITDSQQYWNNLANKVFKQHSHWRGQGIFVDDARWLALGHEHLRLYEEFARVVGQKPPLRRIVEWGCGGGMNAVHFGPLTQEFCGIDISAASLEECGRQMAAAGLNNFTSLLIEASNPEAALARAPGACDLLISTYVFELLPSPEYGIRVLKTVSEMLAPAGIAIIQIKYSGGNWRTASRRWGYVRNLAWNATYGIEEFWSAAEKCGLTPKMVTLVPEQPLVRDRNYAYFLLLKQVAVHGPLPSK
jgi:2-polyprenyl-3-methyl-5-hydroxy-6-metoxy-1,4-benzoquinol methylase